MKVWEILIARMIELVTIFNCCWFVRLFMTHDSWHNNNLFMAKKYSSKYCWITYFIIYAYPQYLSRVSTIFSTAFYWGAGIMTNLKTKLILVTNVGDQIHVRCFKFRVLQHWALLSSTSTASQFRKRWGETIWYMDHIIWYMIWSIWYDPYLFSFSARWGEDLFCVFVFQIFSREKTAKARKLGSFRHRFDTKKDDWVAIEYWYIVIHDPQDHTVI